MDDASKKLVAAAGELGRKHGAMFGSLTINRNTSNEMLLWAADDGATLISNKEWWERFGPAVQPFVAGGSFSLFTREDLIEGLELSREDDVAAQNVRDSAVDSYIDGFMSGWRAEVVSKASRLLSGEKAYQLLQRNVSG